MRTKGVDGPDLESRSIATADLVVSLARIRPERNEWRYYRMEIWPDLFGGALLMRQWGRIGTAGQRRFDMYPDEATASAARDAIARAKQRRGYRER